VGREEGGDGDGKGDSRLGSISIQMIGKWN